MEAFPFRGVLCTPEQGADGTNGFAENAMAIESFDDDRAGVPSPWMNPVRHQAHRAATEQTQESPDPDDNPIPSVSPRTWRAYMPCPTTCKTPFSFLAAWPHRTQNNGRRSFKEGALGFLAQSCSTARTRLCKIITLLCLGRRRPRLDPAKIGLSAASLLLS